MANMEYGESMFIKMMAEEVGKGYEPGSTFNKKQQLDLYRKFRSIFGSLYTDRWLRIRFKLLEERYLNFSQVLNHESIVWNRRTNIVEGNEELLKDLWKSNRMNNGQYRGEEHYDLLCQIFESGVIFE